MKKYNVTVPKKYMSNGEEKTFWANVGKLIKFEGTTEKPEDGYVLELHMFPDTKFGVFEDTPKENKPKETSGKVEYGNEEESDEIPF